MADLAGCMEWGGSRVWLRISAPTTTRRFGHVVNVAPSSIDNDDIDIAIRLEEGAVTVVRASAKGRLWDLAD